MASPKVVVIVGASSGIGEALAFEYAKKKCILVLAARREEKLKELGHAVTTFGAEGVAVIPTDVTSKEACKKMIEQAVEKFGTIDLVIYSAGQAMHSLVEDIVSMKLVYDKVFNVNFYGAVWTSYYASPHLKSSQGQFIVISSVAGTVSPPFISLYSAAKHAIHGFFEALQNEEPGYDICIMCPGYVETEQDGKKIVADGTVQSVDLNVDKSKYMSAERAAQLISEAAKKKKKSII